MRIGNREFDINIRCYVMGILNVTPDSFSDGGRFQEVDRALFQVEKMLEEGMDILDIGGESTRPGHTKISDEEEIGRVVPVIEKVKREFDIPISLDTYKSAVAEAGISAGADMINDIWGLKYDGEMAAVISRAEVPCCLMHNRSEALYEGVVTGIGFGKTYEQNLEMIAKLERLHVLGYPLLLGCSRKSVIGLTLDLPPEERQEGTLATTVIGVLKGCGFVRVHDVKENVRAVKMAEAVKRYMV